ncbi:MAG: amidohydrolase [Actinomycetota bacterium]
MTDLLLTGGPVYLGEGRTTEAVLVQSDRIAAVGALDDVAERAPSSARRVDVHGGMILPAFQDAHVHPVFGGLYQLQCDLHGLASAEAVIQTVRRYVAENPNEDWIIGGGWELQQFASGPDRAQLDAIEPRRPVYLVDSNVHTAWVNSRALQLAGIDRSTPDPADGRIERDADGEPTGLLHEGAENVVRDLVPTPPPEQYLDALRLAQRQLHALGISAWNDAWIEADIFEAYRKLEDAGELTARVVLSLLWDRHMGESQLDDLLEMRKLGTGGHLDANTAKLFLDGVIETFTASVLEPYLDSSGAPTENTGIDMFDPVDLDRFCTLLDREGFQLHFHAIGDRAVRLGLDAIAATRAANGVRDARHHIAHVELVHPDDVGRFGELDVVVNAQPMWAQYDSAMEDLTLAFQSSERRQWMYPLADLLRSGARIAIGSDWPVTTANPLHEIEVAVRRTPVEDPGAEVFLPEQRLDLATALDAFTANSAFVNRDDDSGAIREGLRADLAVVDRNLFELDGRTSEARVLLTLASGEPVFDEGLL